MVGFDNFEDAARQCILEANSSRSHQTARAYRNALNAFAHFLQSSGLEPPTPLDQVNMMHFINFPSWLAQEGYSKMTCNVYMSGVKFFLDWLVIDGSIRPNYDEMLRWQMAVTRIHRKREDRLPRTPEKGAVEKLIDAVYKYPYPSEILRRRNVALVLFLESTGCRVNEIANLKIKDLDLDNRFAKVVGKGNKERKVFLSNRSSMALDEYFVARKSRESSSPVFSRHDRGAGKKIKPLTTATIRDVVEQLCDFAGVDRANFSPHRFRHAFAIKALQKTGNLALVQDLMGHASPTATRVYAKITTDELQEKHREVFNE